MKRAVAQEMQHERRHPHERCLGLLYRECRLLDDEQWDEWLDLLSPRGAILDAGWDDDDS
jgi:3-phenylpropionate/cinnamic acid dioxygenase small subunit